MDKKWVALFVFVCCGIAGWWYWNQRPAGVQAAISEARDVANVNHVMTVEAISEGGSSVVGRRISILNARVTEVTGPQTFWVAGSEGEPLLVVVAPGPDAGARRAAGERVSIDGVVRDEASKLPLSREDQSQVAKAGLHVLATTVRQLR